MQKGAFPQKRYNNAIWLKFVAENGAICIFQLLSTTSWKTILNIYIPEENIAIQNEFCFRWPVHLTPGYRIFF